MTADLCQDNDSNQDFIDSEVIRYVYIGGVWLNSHFNLRK